MSEKADRRTEDAGPRPPPDPPSLTWLEDYGDELFAYALARLTGDRAAAEDIVQETLLAALRAYDRFEHRAKPKTWLIGILRHKIVDHFRTRARQRPEHLHNLESTAGDYLEAIDGFHPGRSWPRDPAQALESQEFWSTFDACLGQLGPLVAEAFILRVMDGLETDEVCRIMEITPTNLSVRLHRARLALRQCLAKNWFGS